MSHPEIGSIVGGRYRLVRSLGEGGMGAVYEAENVLTFKRAAVKWLHPHFASFDQGYQRLIHEARASARIRHENVVDVYDVIHEGEAVFLVMELLHGEPLSELLARAPLPMHELVQLLLAVMRGTEAAHAAGVVHRDVKPENIFLAREPGYPSAVPKLIDFGISKLFDGEGAALTRSGVTMGTPRYVSYEQLIGARDVDARTDIYAFGVLLYEALTGCAPYGEASTFGEQAVRFATTEPARPRALRAEIPEGLEAIVLSAIAKERDERFASLALFIDALVPFARADSYPTPLTSRVVPAIGREEDEPLAATLTPPPTQPLRPAQQHVGEAEATAVGTRSSLPATRRARRLMFAALAIAAGLLALVWSSRSAERTLPGKTAAPPAASSVAAPSAGRDAPTAPLPTGTTIQRGGPPTNAHEAEAARPTSKRPADAGMRRRAVSQAYRPSGGKIVPRAGELSALADAAQRGADAGAQGQPAAPARDPATQTPVDESRHRAGRVRRQEF